MNITPAERDKIARALYALGAGDDLLVHKQLGELWDMGWVPSSVVESYRVKAEDLIEEVGWVLTRE